MTEKTKKRLIVIAADDSEHSNHAMECKSYDKYIF